MRNAMGNTPDDGNILGTSAFYEPNTDADPVISYVPDPFPDATEMYGPDMHEVGPGGTPLKRPSTNVGGFLETVQRLGFSWGLGSHRMATRMRGQMIEAEPMALPADGPVGFATRSTRRPIFLYSDFTPSDEDVARSAMSNWRTVR